MSNKVLKTHRSGSLEALAGEVSSQGGRVLQRVPPSLLIAEVPASARFELGEEARLGVDREAPAPRAWNSGRTPPIFESATEGPAGRAGALRRVRRGAEHAEGASAADEPRAARQLRRRTRSALTSALLGRVAVVVVFVHRERGDAPDPPPEHLDEVELETASAEIGQALAWLATLEPRAEVEFVVEQHTITLGIQPDEATPRAELEAVWRDPALASLGMEPGRDGYRALAEEAQQRNDARSAFVLFVTRYPVRHYAYASNERLVQHFDNGGLGEFNLSTVIAHEICHIFGALDEYGDCDCHETSGELEVPNSNCAPCAADPVPCIMHANALAMCPATRGQIGWAGPLI